MPNQVIVFHAKHCGPCIEYLPRFKRLAVKYRAHLHIRTPDLDIADKRIQDAAIAFKITGTPTTLVLDANDKVLKRKVGGITDAGIERLLKFAAGEVSGT
jgi:thiol-disulfide isomerase/thioredoxin